MDKNTSIYSEIAAAFAEKAAEFPTIRWSLRFEGECAYLLVIGTDRVGKPVTFQHAISLNELKHRRGNGVNERFLALTMDMSAAGFFLINDSGAKRRYVSDPQGDITIHHYCTTNADGSPNEKMIDAKAKPVDNGKIRVTRYEGRCSECGEDIVILSDRV